MTVYCVYASVDSREVRLSTTDRKRAFDYARGQLGFVVRVWLDSKHTKQTGAYVATPHGLECFA
jgi:hypothetical protein